MSSAAAPFRNRNIVRLFTMKTEATAARPMSTTPAAWVASIGNRLSFLQENMLDEPPEGRAAHLQTELRRALQSISANERGVYLEAFAKKYPDWDFALGVPRRIFGETVESTDETAETPVASVEDAGVAQPAAADLPSSE